MTKSTNNKLHTKVGDRVVVVSGKDKGKQGNVKDVNIKEGTILVDGVNVLYKLNTSNVSEIKSERIVYFLRKNDSGKFFLVPGWEITYTDKNGALINEYFNAL